MGEVVEFYRPAKRTPPTAPAPELPEIDDSLPSAAEVLAQVSQGADKMDTILVLGTDFTGVIGVLGNLADTTEILAFMERVKFQILTRDAAESNQPTPRRNA